MFLLVHNEEVNVKFVINTDKINSITINVFDEKCDVVITLDARKVMFGMYEAYDEAKRAVELLHEALNACGDSNITWEFPSPGYLTKHENEET